MFKLKLRIFIENNSKQINKTLFHLVVLLKISKVYRNIET